MHYISKKNYGIIVLMRTLHVQQKVWLTLADYRLMQRFAMVLVYLIK